MIATKELTISHPSIQAIVKGGTAYSKGASSYAGLIRKQVSALQLEGYDNDVIRKTVREALKEEKVSAQFVNRVLTNPVEDGGCGFPKERNRPSKAAKEGGLKEKAAKGVSVDITDAESLFAALLVAFDGKATKILVLADSLNDLAAAAMAAAKGKPKAKA